MINSIKKNSKEYLFNFLLTTIAKYIIEKSLRKQRRDNKIPLKYISKEKQIAINGNWNLKYMLSLQISKILVLGFHDNKLFDGFD